MSILRFISATAAALTALSGVLVAWPGDIVPQYVLLGIVSASTFLSVLAANLSASETK